MIFLRLVKEHLWWIVWEPIRQHVAAVWRPVGAAIRALWTLPFEMYRRISYIRSLNHGWYYCDGCGQLMSTTVSPGCYGQERIDGQYQIVGTCRPCREAGKVSPRIIADAPRWKPFSRRFSTAHREMIKVILEGRR